MEPNQTGNSEERVKNDKHIDMLVVYKIHHCNYIKNTYLDINRDKTIQGSGYLCKMCRDM